MAVSLAPARRNDGDSLHPHETGDGAHFSTRHEMRPVPGLRRRRFAGFSGHGRGTRYNQQDMERTLAIIKPDAVEKQFAGPIIQRVEAAGFRIRAMRRVHLGKAEAEGFYAVHRDRPFFPSLTAFMSSGPAIVMVLEADGAIKKWRDLMGATDPSKATAPANHSRATSTAQPWTTRAGPPTRSPSPRTSSGRRSTNRRGKDWSLP